jgi:hypothetical protein
VPHTTPYAIHISRIDGGSAVPVQAKLRERKYERSEVLSVWGRRGFPYLRPSYANVMTMVSLDTLSHSTPPLCPPPVTTFTIARRAAFALLPEEIIVKILKCCDIKGVLACQRVRATICSLSVDSSNDDVPHYLTAFSVTHRRAALSEMSSWLRQAYGINSLSPNTECATAHRAI